MDKKNTSGLGKIDDKNGKNKDNEEGSREQIGIEGDKDNERIFGQEAGTGMDKEEEASARGGVEAAAEASVDPDGYLLTAAPFTATSGSSCTPTGRGRSGSVEGMERKSRKLSRKDERGGKEVRTSPATSDAKTDSEEGEGKEGEVIIMESEENDNFNSSYIEPEETNGGRRKRKARWSPRVGPLERTNAMVRLNAKTGMLENFSRRTRNVHREIKIMAIDIAYFARKGIKEYEDEINKRLDLEEELKCMKKRQGELEKQLSKLKAMTGSSEKESIKQTKLTCEMAVQVDTEALEEEMKKQDRREKNQILKVLEQGRGFEDLAEVLDKEWPKEVFRNVELVKGGSIHESGWDLMVVKREGEEADKERINSMLKVCPEVKELLTGGVEEGEVKYARISTKVSMTGGVEKENEKVWFIARESETAEEEYKNLGKWIKKVVELGRRKVMVSYPKGVNSDYCMKILEYLCRDTDIKIKLLITKKDLKEGEDRKKTKAVEETLIVKPGRKTFAEMVREMKEKVNIEEVDVRVKTMEKSKEGELILRVEGGREKANKLKECIAHKMGDTHVKIINKDRVIFITDIDAGMSIEEIEDSLKANIGDDQFRLVQVKPTRDGNQVATVEVRADIARVWERKGTMKIGWVRCRINRKITVQRCFKCLEFGHRRAGCQGEDRSDLCYKCSERGHRAKDCKGEPFCRRCEARGHRSDSWSCPKFRQTANTGKITRGEGVVPGRRY